MGSSKRLYSADIALLDERIINERLDLLNTENELDISRNVLNVLLNRPADFDFELSTVEFDTDKMAETVARLEQYISRPQKKEDFARYLVSSAMKYSPELNRYEITINRQQDLIARNRGWIYPELSLRAKYSYSAEFDPELNNRDDYWVIGAVLTWPLFRGGLRSSENRVLKIEKDELLYAKDAARLDLMGEIQSDMGRLITRMTTLPYQYDSRNVSRFNVDSSRDRYVTGRLSLRELIDQERRLADREIRLIDDRFAFFTAYTDILHRLGRRFMEFGTSEDLEFYNSVDSVMKSN